ncbi:GntR family transcriptional regulator [Nesterenkonia sp. CL21]|uniref:GntR family transcriptional regulator n=1 Tax=Nesterenkonia sp. CL21 TaxID=3064894 RepID=UPI00287A45CD|nr:GntR family transcriptional regulator [Nesterenkonia sp. CL21]MDS2172615.1 GntR family transcriptional regulator [Nesterenkonia sp. CL21]
MSAIPDRQALQETHGPQLWTSHYFYDYSPCMGSQSKYAKIRGDLEKAIRSGEFRPGDTIPTERELCATYEVSRATVQRAITSMAEAGLVTRNRRAGTTVTRSATDLLRWTNLLASGPEEEGAHTVLLAETIPASDLDIDLPGHGADDAIHHLRRVKTDPAGDPVAIEEHMIPFSVAPRVMREDLTTFTSMAHFRASGVPVVRSRLYLQPSVATHEAAQLLNLPEGTPVFTGRRETYLQGGAIAEIYLSVLAPHAFQLFVEQTLEEPEGEPPDPGDSTHP